MNIQEILAAREKTHGNFQAHARMSQNLKSVMEIGLNWSELNTAQREALEMIMHKVARILAGNPNEPDHWRDISGYATLVANDLETNDEKL